VSRFGFRGDETGGELGIGRDVLDDVDQDTVRRGGDELALPDRLVPQGLNRLQTGGG